MKKMEHFLLIFFALFSYIPAMQALESTNSLIIEFKNEDDKYIWLKGLVKATYQASVRIFFFIEYIFLA